MKILTSLFYSMIVFTVLALPTMAHAAVSDDSTTSDYRIHLEEQESRFNLGLYAQASQFALQGKSLLGNALEIDATYAIHSNLAANVAVAQALSVQGGLGLLYTELRGAVQYAFWGDFIRRQSTIVVNGQRSIETKAGASTMLAADLGVEQFMFNGTSRIVPATGFALGCRYDRTFGSFRASFIARYGMLEVANASTSMMTGGAGLIYSF